VSHQLSAAARVAGVTTTAGYGRLTRMRFASGTPLAGRYLLLDEIAAGPQAAVWRGMDDVLGRPVAVKLYLGAASDAAARAFVHARARTAARLNHPYATAVYDFGDAPGPSGTLLPYVVMELLDGHPLAGATPLDWPLAVRIGAEIAGALAASHARGVVHGQVGTDAVMLTTAGAKLLGLAGPGRPPAVPPTPADDVYGFGLLLLDALGGPPAAAPEPDLFDPAAQLAAIRDLPAEVSATCLACLATAPADRPTMPAVARTLTTEVNRVAGTLPGHAAILLSPVPEPPAELRRRRPSRGHAALAAAGTVAILVLSGVAVRYGDDLLTAATGPGPGSSATSSGSRATSGGPAPQQGPIGATPRGTTGPGGTTGTTGAPGQPPTTGTGPEPVPPTGGQVSPAGALAALRTSIDDGRAAGQITAEVAAALDSEVDDIVRRAAAGEPIAGRVTALHSRIDAWQRMGDIAASRAADLHAKLNAYAGAG